MPASDLTYRRLSLAIAGVATAFYAVFIARTAFRIDGRTYFSLFDDGMISMRYARNLAHGAGLAWNAGQHPVEGYTNLLWTAWMAVLHLTGVSDARASLLVMASGVVILVANLFVIRALVEELAPGRRGAALAAMAATALFYPLAYWTLRGMEVGLVALLGSVMALYAVRLDRAFDRRTLIKLAAVMAAAVLTRDDVLVPCLVVLAFVLLRCRENRRAAAAVLGGTLVAAVGAHEAFRLAYYGSALPNTYYLKLGGVGLDRRLPRGATALAAVAVSTLLPPLLLGVAGFAARLRRVPAGVWLLAAIVAADSGYSVYVGGDAWEFLNITNRFLTPAIPLLIVLAAVGLSRLSEAPARPWVAVAIGGPLALGAIHLAAAASPAVLTKLPHVAEGGSTARQEAVAAVGAALVAAAAALLLARGRLSARSATLVWPLVAVALVAGTAGTQLDQWRWSGAAYAKADADAARYGVRLREATDRHTTVAVVWAGAVPYFDHRPSVDLLGKSDTTIAHERPRPGRLIPGHMKWDYRHSIAAMRPGVIAQLWRPTPADVELVQRAGYLRLRSGGAGRDLYALPGATGVKLARLDNMSPR